FVSHHVAHINAAMRTDQMKRNFSSFQKLHEELSGHSQDLARLNRRQCVLALQNRHRVSRSQVSEKAEQERVEVVWQDFSLALWTDELRFRLAKLFVDAHDFSLLTSGNWDFSVCFARVPHRASSLKKPSSLSLLHICYMSN